jgi:hypothetical protein
VEGLQSSLTLLLFVGAAGPVNCPRFDRTAGIALMPIAKFFIYSAIGTVIWTMALAMARYLLGQATDTVSAYVRPVSDGILVLILGYYIYRVVTCDPSHGEEKAKSKGKAR